jgi:hypothetical protein
LYYKTVRNARQARIDVQRFDWDEENEGHQKWGLNLWIADDVLNNRPIFFPNERRKTGSHKMIGPTFTGSFWTVILKRTGLAKVWRPITGWPSSDSEVAAYENARPKAPF